MNSVKVRLELKSLPERIGQTLRALEGAGRVELSRSMGVEVQAETAKHLAGLAQTRHASAERVGGTPTGHLAQAAEKVAQPDALSADENAATIVLQHPGLGRALHDVTIVPGAGKKFLTIPMNALAYGRRCGEFDKVIFIHGGDGGKAKKKAKPGKEKKRQPIPTDIPVYMLMTRVLQKQDRTLLPSDAQWTAAAKRGVVTYLQRALS